MGNESIERAVDKFVLSLEQNDHYGASSILQDEYIKLSDADFGKFVDKAIQGTKDSKKAPDLYRDGGSFKVDDSYFWDSKLMTTYKLASKLPATRSSDQEVERASQCFNEVLEDHDMNGAKQAVASLIEFASTLTPEQQFELYQRTEALNDAHTSKYSCLPKVQITFGDTNGDGKNEEAVKIRIHESHGAGRGRSSGPIRSIDIVP